MLFRAQAVIFLLFGLTTGALFNTVVELREEQARMQATARVYLSLPVSALSEVNVMEASL
jgi:hypothetical protein